MKRCFLILGLASGPCFGPVAVSAPLPHAPYELVESYRGQDFFDKFTFWTAEDPSKGVVRYVDRATAEALHLLEADARLATIRADRHVLAAGRKRASVRIQSKSVYNSGLFIARVEHMPTGCGQWPALWLYGESLEHPWPEWGEYDIIEAVHRRAHVRTTLHTAARCRQNDVQAGRDFTGTWDEAGLFQDGTRDAEANDCFVGAAGQLENEGCSQRGPAGSIGPEFNANGGGTFAAEWDARAGHIRTWFWPAGTEPPDVRLELSQGPVPELWGEPYSFFAVDEERCTADHLKNMRLVININFCGEFGNSVWEESCPVEAARGTCEAFVQGQTEALEEAYWAIGGIQVYQRTEAYGEPAVFIAAQPVLHDEDIEHWSLLQQLSGCLGVLLTLGGLAGCAVLLLQELRRQRAEEDQGATLEDERRLLDRSRQLMMTPTAVDDLQQGCNLSANGFVRALMRLLRRSDACGGGADLSYGEVATRARSRSSSSGTSFVSPQDVQVHSPRILARHAAAQW